MSTALQYFRVWSHGLIHFLILLAFSLTGCLKEEPVSTLSANSTTPTPSPSPTPEGFGFLGVNEVQNLTENSIKISWLAATGSHVVGYRVYEVEADGTLRALQQVSASKLAYIHTGLTLGSTHSYMVRAVSSSGETDSNIVVKSIFTFGGISSATATGLNSVSVAFTGSTSLAGINIYFKDHRGGTWTLAGTASNTASSYTVSGLKSGTTYSFKAMGVDISGDEDVNPHIKTVQTYSSSFYPPTPSVAKYAGPILVQAYGLASGAPSGTVSGRQVMVLWAKFSFVSHSYALFRVVKGGSLDVSTTAACTSSTTSTCLVCTITGTGNQSCTDTNVGAPPAAYDYVVTSVIATNWPEELPTAISDAPFRITVPIPPDNMVLVHRDSVNYEQCYLMGKTPDAQNHQRCAISGSSMIGAAPYSSNFDYAPLNLPTGYYDFGYNLFVDRWEAACNWTPSTNGGMCGAGATSGHCFGTGVPASTIGVAGNVYVRTNTGKCYYRRSSGWVDLDGALTAAERAAAYTIDPKSYEGKKTPIAHVNVYNAYNTCVAQVDSNYGAKRLMRKREFIAAAAWPIFSGEPNVKTETQYTSLESGSGHPDAGGEYTCNTLSHAGIGTQPIANWLSSSYELTRDSSSGGPNSFIIGSNATKNCVSRFGAQDLIGNLHEFVGDQVVCNSTSHTCVGTKPDIDSGNGYASGFDLNGFNFNGIQGPGGTSAGQVGPYYTGAWYIKVKSFGTAYFNTALGIPLVDNDNGNAIPITGNEGKFNNDEYSIETENTPNQLRAIFVGGGWDAANNRGGRWFTNMRNLTTWTSEVGGFRCALPAE